MSEAIAELSAEPVVGAGLRAGWWARGLTLAERCALPDPPPEAAVLDERSARRLERWRERNRLAESGQFARRLAAAGLTEAGLGALLAEDPHRLAARTERPDWAEFTESALARVVDGRRLPDPPADEQLVWQAGFRLVVAPFVEVAVDRFMAAVDLAGDLADDLVEVGAMRHGLADQVSQHLATIASRTLVLELNVLRVTGRLEGTTPRERFWAFVRHFTGPAGFAALLDEYPVLARLLADKAALTVEAYLELLDRLAADRDAIVAELFAGNDPGRLVEAAFGSGDQHGRGRSVALLRFAGGGRLVYKPRPMAVHRHVNEFVDWLNRTVAGPTLPALTVLDRGGYGWVEFAEHRPCADRGEVERYYRRLGLLLGLLYALDCTDVHFENVIASGDRPVLVDLETVFHHSVPVPGIPVADDPAATALGRSVSRVGLLPAVSWNDEGAAFDMGGIGGDAGNPLPFKNPTWAGAGTDEMRLVRDNLPFNGSKNRPRLGGAEVEPGEFAGELLAGFRAAYDAIVEHREHLVGDGGLLWRFAGDEVREVLRATMTYARLMTESTHPDVMRDALDRDAVFDCLWAVSVDDPLRESLVPDEIAGLWRGDVPIFMTRPGSTGLTTGDGRCLNDVFEEPALVRAVEKVRGMGPQDRRTQEWIIRGSLATRFAGVPALPMVALSPAGGTMDPSMDPSLDPSHAVALARELADRLADEAYVEGDRASWLGLTLANESQWTVRPLSFDLFNGYPGVALFLGQLAMVTGDERYAELARAALAPVRRLVEEIAEVDLAATPAGLRPAFGTFDGLSGLAYALVLLDGVLDSAEVASWVAALVPSVEAAVAGDEVLDVIGGSAGCLAAMLAIHEATGLDVAARVARACAARLAETARPHDGGVGWSTTIESSQPLTGFSHGAAGIGWALLRYAAATGDRSHADLGRAAFGYERGAHRQAGSWPDFRVLRSPQFGGGAQAGGGMHSWCHGAPGVGLARADSLCRTPDPELAEDLAEDLDAALTSVLSTGPLASQCLCHGELGNLEMLTAAVAAGRTDLAAERDRRGAHVLASLDRVGPVCGTPGGLATPGLMTGLAGIGHGLLRLAFPDRIPAVLLLEPPGTGHVGVPRSLRRNERRPRGGRDRSRSAP